jgi:hypothetical protein
MFVHTSYRESGASALVNYIEQDHPLRNSAGRELSGHEVRDFIDKSERHEFEREFQLSPDPEAAVSQRALERQTHRFIGEFLTTDARCARSTLTTVAPMSRTRTSR